MRNAIFEARDKWYDIGIELNLSFKTLNVIEKDCPNDCGRCLTKMLIEWLSSSYPPPTWSDVVDALSSRPVGEKRLAEDIKTKDCTSSGSERIIGIIITI